MNIDTLTSLKEDDVFVTKSAKTGLICTKYTYSFYHTYLFFCVGYTISESYIKFLRKFCVFDEIFDKVLCKGKELLNLKGSKLGHWFLQTRSHFVNLDPPIRTH